MKFTKTSTLLACAIAAATASSFTFADEDTGFYLGGNIGQTRARLDEQSLVNSVMAPGYTATLYTDDMIDGGYKLFAGYQFSRYFSIEGGYFDLGEFNFVSWTNPLGQFDTNMKVRGVNLDLVGSIPFTDKFSAFARVGVNYALTQDTFKGTDAATGLGGKLSDRDTNAKAGVGLQYALNDSFALRLEAERYRVSDAVGHKDNIDLFSVGAVYRFGAKTEHAPVVVAPPPAPAPVVTPPPPPQPRFEKYTLSSTELFGFDSDTLHLPQPKLDEIADALKSDGGPRQIVIVGYTDRLGAPDYNQKLSERRANSVKNYLIGKGIEADRLQTVGKGEADPVVQCHETKKAALIECLKPNRRVEIDQVVVERKVNP